MLKQKNKLRFYGTQYLTTKTGKKLKLANPNLTSTWRDILKLIKNRFVSGIILRVNIFCHNEKNQNLHCTKIEVSCGLGHVY